MNQSLASSIVTSELISKARSLASNFTPGVGLFDREKDHVAGLPCTCGLGLLRHALTGENVPRWGEEEGWTTEGTLELLDLKGLEGDRIEWRDKQTWIALGRAVVDKHTWVAFDNAVINNINAEIESGPEVFIKWLDNLEIQLGLVAKD